MNILIIPSFIYSKKDPTLGSFVFEQAEALSRKGHSVSLLFCDTYSLKEFSRWFKYKEANEEKLGVKVYRKRAFCVFKHGSGFYGCREQFANGVIQLYYDHLVQEKIDVIHAHCCVWAGYAAMKLSEKTGIPYVITEHSSIYSLDKKKIRGRYCNYIAEAFSKAQKVLCVSTALQNLLKPYCKESEILGNVIDCTLFCPNTYERQPGGATFFSVLYMKTLHQIHNKGMDLLLTSFSEVVKQYPDSKLLLGGDGPARQTMEQWIEEKGLQNHVTMLGALSRQEVARKMQQCDAFVLPSRYETFGVSYAEAMACGKPVIATRNGGPDSFVTEDTGFLINVENVDELTQAMLSMVESYHNFDSEKIRAHIESLFSMDAVARHIEEIYREIV